jgi:3-oxoacyl-[acyl-carrier-protein] synthase-3
LRIARDLLRAEQELKTVLLVAACRESYLLDYTNERSRFMFNFGDGAVAGLLRGDADRNEVLGAHTITNGAYSLQVKVPGGGSVEPDGYRFLDVQDPREMKGGLDQESLPNFLAAARGAAERSGLTLDQIDFVCPLHTKRSMFVALLSELGMREDQAVYLDDTGHMSGVDPLLALDRAVRENRVREGDAVLLLSAGTGYTWAATVVRWGPAR